MEHAKNVARVEIVRNENLGLWEISAWIYSGNDKLCKPKKVYRELENAVGAVRDILAGNIKL